MTPGSHQRYGIETTCSDCMVGNHERCDGEAWNDAFECVVDCACPVCLARVLRT